MKRHFVVTQETLLDAVIKLQGSITDDVQMSEVLHETQTNIDRHRSMLQELHYMQVYTALCRTLPLFTACFPDCSIFCLQNILLIKLYFHSVFYDDIHNIGWSLSK